MTTQDLASALLGSVLMALVILLEIYLWQRKEYRWDRMRAYLLSQERKALGDVLLSIFATAIGIGWLLYLADQVTLANVFGWAALAALAGRYVRLYMRSGVYRPQLTHKGVAAVILGIVSAVALLSLMIMGTQLLPLQLATVLLVLPLGIAAAIAVTNIIANTRKRAIIAQAARMHRTVKPTTIAVTGSVGKTSVKEYLTHIVREAGKNVVATKEHRNSEFTVAQDVLEQLPQKPDVYVVEAAAYRRGEVASIARLVQPDVGIITAVTNQHEALFGSLAVIAKAKWELADYVKTCVLNIDDDVLKERAAKARTKIVSVSMRGQADVYVSDTSFAPEHIAGQVHIGEHTKSVVLPLVGDGALMSALLAVGAAYAAKIKPSAIFAALESLPTIPRTMQVREGAGGVTILDDSYSASEAAIRNAITHLSRFSQQNKFVVLVPLIELSASAESAHENIGRLLAGLGAKVYIFGHAYQNAFKCGAGKDSNIIWFNNPSHLAAAVRAEVSKDSVVLLEGRIPDKVRQVLL